MIRSFVPVALFVTAVVGCGTVPDDPGARIFAAAGVIRGTVLYQGQRPCSLNGHIVGNAILFVFDRRNPPPPNGLSNFPSNFGVVTGDSLFANEPRWTGSGPEPYCPPRFGFTETITVSTTFAVAPMAAGSYEIQGFYDYTGDFLPTFKFRQLPEQGDVGGGDVDTADALKPINAGNPNYQPHFLPVNVGVPETGTPLLSLGGAIPTYDMPSSGYVTDDVTVSLGQTLTLTRPYFYPKGLPWGASTVSMDGNSIANGPGTELQSSDTPAPNLTDIPHTADTDANYAPILTIPQDIQALAAPDPTDITNGNANVDLFEGVIPHLRLVFGVADAELPCATGGSCAATTDAPGQQNPFRFQLQPSGPQGGFSVWQNAIFDQASQKWYPLSIPEGNNVPMLWPLVILGKLVDSTPTADANGQVHTEDPASLSQQGSAGQPVVIMQGITLLNAPQANPLGGMGQPDTLFNTLLGVGSDQLLASGPYDPNTGSAYNGTLFNYATGTPTVFQQSELTVAMRPAVICFSHLFDSPAAADQRGTLVSPFSGAAMAKFAGGGAPGAVIPTDILSNGDVKHRFQITNLVKSAQFGCLPRGRYGINVVYPTGQAWTVPNEAGACSGSEGSTQGLTCSLKPRPVLYSQGNRAVVEVVAATDPANCASPGPAASTTIDANAVKSGSHPPAVPVDCLPRCETQACPGSDACTQVNDPNTGGTAMVCIPPLPPTQ